jgi:hypothetical protein
MLGNHRVSDLGIVRPNHAGADRHRCSGVIPACQRWSFSPPLGRVRSAFPRRRHEGSHRLLSQRATLDREGEGGADMAPRRSPHPDARAVQEHQVRRSPNRPCSCRGNSGTRLSISLGPQADRDSSGLRRHRRWLERRGLGRRRPTECRPQPQREKRPDCRRGHRAERTSRRRVLDEAAPSREPAALEQRFVVPGRSPLGRVRRHQTPPPVAWFLCRNRKPHHSTTGAQASVSGPERHGSTFGIAPNYRTSTYQGRPRCATACSARINASAVVRAGISFVNRHICLK